MSMPSLFLIAVGLSMDALAAAVCKGLSLGGRGCLRSAAVVALWFGGFQAAMPLIGYLLGRQFESRIAAFDHWIAFVLLGLIGGNMLRESLSGEEDTADSSLSVKSMLPLAVATSIDALAVGVTFAFLQVSILPAVGWIGATTFLLSGFGAAVGSRVGARCQNRAEAVGGLILIAMGIKILAEHLLGRG